MRRRPPARPDTDEQAMLRRATRTIAALTAGSVAVVVAAVLLLVAGLSAKAREAAAERILGQAATAARGVGNPPPEIVLVIRRADSVIQYSQPTPEDLLGLDPGDLPTGFGDLSRADDHRYRVFVVDKGPNRVLAAMSTREAERESARLVAAILPAGVLGIVAAALIGGLVARRAVRPLGDALALQRRFVADASHELRTPLAILHTRAQLLHRRATADPGLRGHLDRLVDDTRSLGAIVDDLLLSAQLAHRQVGREFVDLAAMARTVACSFTTVAEPAGVRVAVDIAPGVRSVVAGVPVALRRAVSSLVDNALGHSHRGGEVLIRVSNVDGRVELSVIDHGDGFEPDDSTTLTKRFARGRDAPGQGRRFGLGLALVSEVVQAHGGTLRLDGRPGHGATATISLPVSSERPDVPPLPVLADEPAHLVHGVPPPA